MNADDWHRVYKNDGTKTKKNERSRWIVVLDQPMTYDEAIKFGKAIGKQGYTGVFLNGTQAKQIALIPKLKAEIKRLKGGDLDGETADD